MTKISGQLTPPQTAAVKGGCEQCMQIRRQAEEAFTELRAQTDRHIFAIQKKLKEEHASELFKVKSANDILTAELMRVKEQLAARSEKDSECELRIESIKSECEQAERRLREHEKMAEKDRDEILRSHKRELNAMEATIEEKAERIEDLEVQVQSLKSQGTKAKMEHQFEQDRQLRLVSLERDDLKEQLALANKRLGSLDNWKTEADLERAKLDLAYRKRMGEMESEVRRTEIESVRLRREIIQLNQKLELSESGGGSSNFLMLRSGRPRQLSLEGISRPHHPPLSSGRITRIASNNVEELPPPLTPSSN